MIIYTTKAGDVLDAICWRYYGYTAGAVEAVLMVNRGLGALGAVYAAGVEIHLPDATPPAGRAAGRAAPVRLWD